MKYSIGLPLSVLLLAGCFEMQEPVVEPAAEPAAEIGESETAIAAPAASLPPVEGAASRSASIDWSSARADFAAQAAENPDGLVGVETAGDSAVPVLLPNVDVFSVASEGEAPLTFTPVPDGYFAVVQGDAYDMIINGSDKLVAAPEGMEPLATGDMRFEDTLTGSQVTFSRYGASYLVEFACKDAAPSTSCVSEDDAVKAVEDLLLAGTQ